MIRKVTLASGRVVYRARVGSFGKLRTFDRKADAEEYVGREQEERRRERAGLAPARESITYDQLCKLFLDGYAAESKSWTEDMLAYSRAKFGKSSVRSLRPEEIARWLHGLSYSNKTKKHILERMRVVLTAGVEWGYLSISPARPSAIRGPSGNRIEQIKPFESWNEVLRVSQAMPSDLDGAVVRFACSTGLRPSEWQRLRWGDVNVKEKTLYVPGTKTKNAPRNINLSGLSLSALTSVPRSLDSKARVFPIVRYDYWRKDRWRRALTLAGLELRPPGQMRHTFATLALAAGVPIDAVSKMLGHADISITLRYYAKHIPASMAQYAALLDTLSESTSPTLQSTQAGEE